MKLATIQAGGKSLAAIQVAQGYLPLPASNLSELLKEEAWFTTASRILENHGEDSLIPTDEVQLLNPVPAPSKVICCGLNYADHILEMGRELPQYPTLFAKFADTLTGPDSEIISTVSSDVDWEAELAVVIGAEISNASEEEATAAIAGYTVANDISMRDWQRRTLQWFQGKAFDGTTPLGPVLATAEEIDPEMGVEVICRINGEEVQRGNTSTFVYSAARLIAYISEFTTLRPGDIVLTGTPGGVGMGMNPPRFLCDGDELQTEIPGIGTLINRFRLRVDVPAATH
ncbi:2-hydroxyhepta-2,4-diene-1,7-dioate isomerase [Arthrobacter sp. MYb211]|uniref:fumarylacetoacetate hydrolase family protein n=1 Tax=Micrococcaceae TaxID=1268 RepID=UPI000CFBF248|nr:MULTISPECIES: fumarylacetoacetate hydrolase family protein [unclassified Arthrobacter]PQZ96705.1 2-hydroxyhepta-2,4-diene-1,7-dioate isomerase [Arthrobacter sp. MYb224]PRA01934.1 2-hydroxyhepta-2,4-diene-1,7-dioate isomerase [Arthrobacter sp. MYb229]PRA13110.1 2-hydroxyhepta-2,4-diene-1,7-dioate isomerase [Arthrobacter sp. MYb221]PRB50443.1 2-hydroxyhepta-2,4-diene-1,7-dioate isomerase [Arthrobacter sp. MYb216]PRC10303.1 2-hydroxyhepta-2,4-diene-1,7-dioate isomerase [Arthrobacter sp. MYb211